MKSALIALALAALVPSIAYADTALTYGDTTVVTGSNSAPAWQLTSDPAGTGYAGVYVNFSSLLLSQVTTLSADYQFVTGTNGGGAPRFSIGDTTNNANNEAYIYFGTPGAGGTFSDPNAGAYGNTGNYASLSSSDIRVQVNGFGGDSTGASYETWDQFVTKDGGVSIGFISLDLDGGFTGKQVLDVENFDISGTIYNPAVNSPVPEPGTFAMLGTGLLGLVGVARRKMRR